MIPPATAWLVRPGIDRSRRGTLVLDQEGLTFTAEDGERMGMSRDDLERVRRLRGTPVLEVRCRRHEQSVLLLFYFVEPPPMGEPPVLPRPGGRRAGRVTAIRRLRAGNRRLKPLVERWARAVGEAMEA